MNSFLQNNGYVLWAASVNSQDRALLRNLLFQSKEAGTRCLLDFPVVVSVARQICRDLIDADVIPLSAVAIQAIAFDKSVDANWKVTWHQDVMFPFARSVGSDGYDLASLKDGVDFARPPHSVLKELLAVRLHLDDCDAENGPLRVAPRTHNLGLISSADIHAHVANHGETVCLAKEGEALLMHPLILHASSKAVVPRHRRVLHLVYHSGVSMAEQWHRAIPPNQALEPTRLLVMPRACARVTPTTRVAHLER